MMVSPNDRHDLHTTTDLVPETAATAALYATQPRKTDRDAPATPSIPEPNSEYMRPQCLKNCTDPALQ